MNFLQISQLTESHRVAVLAWGKFSRGISVELSLPINERTISGKELIRQSRLELDKLSEQCPDLPLHLVRKFGQKFENKKFAKPEILEIEPVNVFSIDTEKEVEERIEKGIQDAAKEIEVEMEQRAKEATIDIKDIGSNLSHFKDDLNAAFDKKQGKGKGVQRGQGKKEEDEL